MKIQRLIAVFLSALVLSPSLALAAPQCFQPFTGVYIRFEQPVTSTEAALTGRVWGALSSCDGLVSWPVVGSSHFSKTDGLTIAFRAFTVDATVCGAVDYIGTLSGTPLTGPFQLFNQRTNFGNTGTWTEVACPKPPAKGAAPAGVDVQGNLAK
jgi:hypothetical protein